jgi:hypothetical protein
MIIEIVLLILAVPVGYLIAWMARDELVAGQKWFRALVVASVVLAGLCWLFGALIYLPLALIFIAIVSFVSLVKSKDKKWTKKKI